MLVMKIMGILLIITSSYMVGEWIYQKEKQRLSILCEMHKLGRIFKADIRCNVGEIEDVLTDAKERVAKIIEEILDEVITSLREKREVDVSNMWKKTIRKKLSNSYLKEEDYALLDKFGENMGYLDREMQIENTKHFINEIDDRIKVLKGQLKEKDRLYKTLSVCTGICIVLICV